MAKRKQRLWLAVAAVTAVWPLGRAQAQSSAAPGAEAAPPAPAANPEPAPNAPATGSDAPAASSTNPPAAAPGTVPNAQAGAPVLAPPAVGAEVAAPDITSLPSEARHRRPRARQKLQLTTVGMLPTAADFGGEADLISTLDETHQPPQTRRWNYVVRGFFRAPMLVGYGPHNRGTPGHELHSPPRVPGFSSNDWNFAGLTSGPSATVYLSATNGRVSGTLLLAANSISDPTYPHLDQMASFSQAYLTFTFPEALGSTGGLAWTVGSFSNRYGTAGPNQDSTGYYGTYLFGRTHVAGEALTADLDLSDDVELVLEHGLGAKIEVIPFVSIGVPAAPGSDPGGQLPFLPNPGPAPQGSNFVHHAHAALILNQTLRLGVHYMTSWSPNDASGDSMVRAKEARLTVVGGEAHLDSASVGHGYVGYSHLDGSNLLPLADGIQVLHGADGTGISRNYFGDIDPTLGPLTNGTLKPPIVSGKLDSVLFQYMIPSIPVLGPNRDLNFAVYGMYNHASSGALKQDKLKVGAELQFAPIRYLALGARFDRVSPNGSDSELSYSAFSPRLIIHSHYLSREYILLGYTRYFLGDKVTANEPNLRVTTHPDPNMFVISAQVAF